MSNRANGLTLRVAEMVYGVLIDRRGDDIPSLAGIGRELPIEMDSYGVRRALEWLQTQRMITFRTGGRKVATGHLAIRVRSTNRVYRTGGCPFDPPELDQAA